jgi:EpsI family protein
MSKLLVAMIFVALNLYTFRFFASEDRIPERESFVSFPLDIDGWHCGAAEEMGDDILDRLHVTDYLLCNYVKLEGGGSGERRSLVNFYSGYHETQTRSASGTQTIIHPPEHCLPGAGWDIIDSQVVPIDFGIPGEAKRVVIAKGNQRNLVYFWYQSRGRVIARNHEKVLYMFLDRAVEGRTDGSLIRFTIPVRHGDEAAAEKSFRSLASALTPALAPYVPN